MTVVNGQQPAGQQQPNTVTGGIATAYVASLVSASYSTYLTTIPGPVETLTGANGQLGKPQESHIGLSATLIRLRYRSHYNIPTDDCYYLGLGASVLLLQRSFTRLRYDVSGDEKMSAVSSFLPTLHFLLTSEQAPSL